jgi:hypothetical protein
MGALGWIQYYVAVMETCVDTNTADDVSREHVCGEVLYALDPVEETLPRGGVLLHTDTEASHGWDMLLGTSRTISR